METELFFFNPISLYHLISSLTQPMNPAERQSRQSNENSLPPLQLAIKENNLTAVEFLVKQKHFGIAYRDGQNNLILCENDDQLKLQLVYTKSGGLLSISSTILACYAGFEFKSNWVVAELPELSKVHLFENDSSILKVTHKNIQNEGILQPIVKCESHKPLFAAFRSQLIDTDANLKDNTHLRDYICKYGSKQVVIEYLTDHGGVIFEKIENFLFMIEAAIKNPKVLPYLLEVLSNKEKDSQLDPLLISQCRSRWMELSIDSDDTKALDILIEQGFLISSLYGDLSESILQLVLRRGDKPEFITSIFKKSDFQKINIEDESKNLIPLIDWKNKEQHTALHICIKNNCVESLKVLLESTANIFIKDSNENTALHHAVIVGCDSLVTQLVEKIVKGNISNLDIKNKLGCTPLHLAVEKEYMKILIHLLEKGASYYAKDNRMNNLLHYAVNIRDPESRKKMVDYILKQCKDADKPLTRECDDVTQSTPLHTAIELQYINAVELIIGSDRKCMELKDIHGMTSLHLAVIPKLDYFTFSVSLKPSSISIFEKILASIGEETDNCLERLTCFKDNQGKSVLHLCIKYQNYEALSKLLEYQLCLNIADIYGNTPLHEAVLTQNETTKECLKKLLDTIKNKPQLILSEYHYALNNSMLTPLHLAIQHSNKFAIEVLKEYGFQLAYIGPNCRITLLDGNGELALQFITKHNEYYTGYEIQCLQKKYWIVSDIPALETMLVFDADEMAITRIEQFVETVLLSIVQCRSFEPLRAAFRNGLDPEGRLENGQHISQFIARNSTSEVMCFYLIDHNWSLYHFPNESSMIECAIYNPNSDTLELLLQRLPRIKCQELAAEDEANPSDEQLISLCLYNSLKHSITKQDTNALELLLKYDARINYTYPPSSDTLLHLIIKQMNEKFIFAEIILNKLGEIHNVKLTHFDTTPFLDASNTDGKTAIHLCIELKQFGLLTTLLRYQHNPLVQDHEGETALHLAVNTKDIRFVQLLTGTNSDKTVIEAQNNRGYTPLHCSIDLAQIDIAKHLLKIGADFYTIDYSRQTLLHHAVKLSDEYIHSLMIDFILQYEKEQPGENTITKMQDLNKYCPLHLAVFLQHYQAVITLLQYDSSTLSMRDKVERSPLHLAVLAKKYESPSEFHEVIFDYILKKVILLTQSLTEQDCPIIDYQDLLGKTAIHYCISLNNLHALDMLLPEKPNLLLRDKDGNTPLHQAVLNHEYSSLLRPLLISINAESSVNEYHYSLNSKLIPPLQLAIQVNNIPAINILTIRLQLAFEHPIRRILTLCDGIGQFSLSFIVKKCSVTKESYYSRICYTGYEVKYDEEEYWIVSQLPRLNSTFVFQKSVCLELYRDSIQTSLLPILKCKSQEPLTALFRKGFLEPSQWLSNGLFMSQFISQHATEEVMEYYLTQHDETLFSFQEPDYKSMIESSICNPELNTIELLLKRLGTIDNTHELPAVKACLHNSLEFSLDNEEIGALSLLLEYKSKLNDTYGHRNDSLLHLIIINDKHHTFISCLLGKVDPLDQSTQIDNTPLIDAKNLDSKTALHLVIEKRNLRNLTELLGYKPSLGVKDSFGDTALHYSVFIEDLEIVKEIVTAIKVENQTELLNLSNNEGCTALHLAVYLGNIEIAEYLLSEGCDYLARDLSGQTMLHYAVRIPSGDTTCSPMVKFILQHDELHHDYANLKSKNINQRTPLHIAVIEDHQLIIQHLIDSIIIAEQKFDDTWISDRVLCYQDSDMKTALHMCVERRNIVALEYLLSTCSCLHLNDKDRNSILHTATIDHTDEVSIQKILKSIQYRFKDLFEGYLYDAINEEELTPLQYAIKNSHFTAVHTLVETYNASIVYERPRGTITLNFNEKLPLAFFKSIINCNEFYIGYSFTPKIGYQTGRNIFVVCQLPLRIDDLSHTIITDSGTFEEILITSCDRELREYLLQAILRSQTPEPLKAYNNISKLTTDADLWNRSTLMHFAAEYGTEQVIKFLFNLLTFDYTETDGDRNGIFHRAVYNEIHNVVYLLHNIGDITAIINIKNRRGLQPLDIALSENKLDVFLQYIIMENKAVLNYYDPSRNTLIHNIVVNRHKTEICLEEFLEEVNMREKKNPESTFINGTPMVDCCSQANQERYTALHLSIIENNYTALEILFKYNANLNLTALNSGFSIVHLAILHHRDDPQFLEIILKTIFPQNCCLFNSRDTRGYLWPIPADGWPETGSGPLVLARTMSDVYCCLHGDAGWGLGTSSSCGYSPLHLAISIGNSGFVEYLLNGLNMPIDECKHEYNSQLFVRDPEGYTPLHYATLLQTSEAINIIRLLFEAEKQRNIINNSILTQRCNEGKTPLHTTLSKSNYTDEDESSLNLAFDILLLILEYTHQHENTETSELDSITYLDSYNRSILHHAVITNNIRIISRVLGELTTKDRQDLNRFGRLLLNLQDYDGKTALHITIENKNYDAFKELMKYMPLLHLRDREKHWTVLHYIIDGDCSHEFLVDTIEAIGKDSVVLNIMDVNGLSPLHLSIKRGNIWAVEQLVGSDATLSIELGEVGSDAPLSIELGEIGCDAYTVGASVEKNYIMLGKTEKTEENITQIEEYIVAFKHGNYFLVSTLPELKDTKFLKDKDVEFTFSESLVRACLGSKCPELIEKLLNENKIMFDTLGIRLMHLAAQWASKPVMKYLCDEVQPEFDFESLDNYGNTLIHCGAMNRKENVKTLKYILRKTEEFQKSKNINQKIIKLRNYKSQTALQISINDKKYQFFIALIKRGANIEQRNQDGNGIIHILLEKQSKGDEKPYDIIKFLIDEIVKSEKLVHKLSNFLNIKNNKGLTALQIAIKISYKDIVKLLIDNNASLSEIDPKSGNTIVHLATDNERNDCNMELFNTVIKAVKRRDKDRLSNTILNRRNSDQKTPLHISVRGKEKVFMTKSLLDAGVPLEIYDRDKNTALHIATENKDEETVKVIMQHLIKRGREYRLAERGWEYMRELVRENKKKQIPVCIPTSPSILKSMLQAWNHFYSVNFGEGRRGFLIHLAVFEQNTSLVKGIVDGMKEIEKHYENGSRDLVGNILSSRDNEDLTPLHIAAEKGNEQIAHILIRAGADIQLNSAKGTSFEVAMQKDHTELALYLVGEGANIDKYPNLLAYDKISNQYIQDEIFAKGKVNLKRRISSADCTIIHYAAKQSSVSRISFLLRNGIALTASDRDGKRVLHYAIQYRDNNYDVLKFFLDEATKRDELDKDPPNHLTFMEALMHRDLDGITPVMLAASLDRIDFFKLLITPSYEYLLETFDTRDPDENNVIHYLANNKSIKTAQLIVPHIQKTNIDLFTRIMNGRNVDGHSPIDLARKRGMQEMVDLFVDLCDLEYFEACPDVVHRMVRDRDFDNFSKVLEKAVITDSRNVQVATKLMDSNEEGDYPNFAFFNFNLAPLWHKLYRSNVAKFKYHPIVKFLIEEKLTIYRWWFMGLFFFYLFLFYVPFITALFLASSKCDSQLFLYDSHADRFRFCLELYILMFTWLFMVNEVLEIEGKWRYIRNLSFTSFELNYRRQHQVLYYGDREPNRRRKFIQSTVKFLFYKLPILLHKRIFDFDRKHRFILRAIYQHLKETYSVIDMCSIVSLILLFFFRLILFFTESSTLSVLHWSISALTFSLFTFKFYKYTKIFPSLGIYIETLSNVLSTDVPRFSLVIVILLLSYVGSIQLVARTYCNYNGGQCSFSDWFGDPSVPFSSFTTPFISGLLFIIDGGPGNYEGSFRDVPLIFSLFYLVFAFCIIVVLLNVFIAQLSQTYANIYSNKNLIDFKADLTLEYETQSNVLFKFDFPIRRPLKRIMVQSIIIPLETWKSYLRSYNQRISDSTEGTGTEELQNNSSDSSNALLQSITDIRTKVDLIEERQTLNQSQGESDDKSKGDSTASEKQTEFEGNFSELMKKMQRIDENLAEYVDKQNKFMLKFDKNCVF